MKNVIRVSLLLLSLSFGLLANAQLNYYDNNYYYGNSRSRVIVGVKAGLNLSDLKNYTYENNFKN